MGQSFDFGSYIIGCGFWLAVSMAAGLFVATSTNLVGHFKPTTADGKRGPLDWLIWYFIATAAVFVSGQGVFWVIKAGLAIHSGTLFAHDAG